LNTGRADNLKDLYRRNYPYYLANQVRQFLGSDLYALCLKLFFLKADFKVDNGAIIFIIVAVECNLGVVCGCLPGVRPLMSKIFPGLTSSTFNSGRGKISHVQISSGLRSGNEFQDLHSIHVRKDVELSVVKKSGDERWDRPQNPAGRSDSEEWIFRP
jgi:hypothetical protein